MHSRTYEEQKGFRVSVQYLFVIMISLKEVEQQTNQFNMLVYIWMERFFTLVPVHLNKNIFRKHETYLITLWRSEHSSKKGKIV